jgi:hypothetical protein
MTVASEFSLNGTLLVSNWLSLLVWCSGNDQAKCEQAFSVCGCERNDQVSCAEGITCNHNQFKVGFREPCFAIWDC